jgi:hypothetical protein
MGQIMTAQTVDTSLARELTLFIENDGTLYRQMYRSIVKNYARKVVKRVYNRTQAIRGVVHLVNEGIVRYRREFGLPPVNQATKESAAKQILSGMAEEIRMEVKALKAAAKLKKPAPRRR